MKLDKMTTAEIGKFLVVCALASELYLPTSYGNTTPKDSRLTKEATHYRVNIEPVLREVKKRLTIKSAKPKPVSKSLATASCDG